MYDTVFRFLRELCHDEQAAEELTQETFLACWNCKDELMNHPNPDGWIFVTARNKALNYLRLHYHGDKQDMDDEENPVQYASSENMEEALLEQIFGFSDFSGVLSEEEIGLLKLRFTEGYEVKEIARMKDVSEAACKMRFSRIFAKLRAHPELFVLILVLIGGVVRG